jgi:hypothetical protein
MNELAARENRRQHRRLIEQTVNENSDRALDAILDLTVIDPACGSLPLPDRSREAFNIPVLGCPRI